MPSRADRASVSTIPIPQLLHSARHHTPSLLPAMLQYTPYLALCASGDGVSSVIILIFYRAITCMLNTMFYGRREVLHLLTSDIFVLQLYLPSALRDTCFQSAVQGIEHAFLYLRLKDVNISEHMFLHSLVHRAHSVLQGARGVQGQSSPAPARCTSWRRVLQPSLVERLSASLSARQVRALLRGVMMKIGINL